MQTLVLKTPASQEPLESFFQRLGNEAIEVIGDNGKVLAQVIPTGTAVAQRPVANEADWVDPRVMAEISQDIDSLKSLAREPRSTTTTEELLRLLNSLPLMK